VARIYEYAIIRFVPEAFRGEQVNIGLVVLKDDHFDVRLHLQPSLISALGADPSKLTWIEDYLRENDNPELSDAERWSLVGAFPGFALSDIGWLTAETDEQYELRIDRVRRDYVDRPKAKSFRTRSSTLVREMRNVFRDYHIMGRQPEDVYRHKVVANVPVGPAGKLHVDFVVKNGVYHATETADFRRALDSGVAELKEAALASFTLQYAREQLGQVGTKCYLAYAAPAVVEAALSPALQVAERGVDRLFNLESADQRRGYFDLMLSAAGAPRFNSER
jgi:hypothetical protein